MQLAANVRSSTSDSSGCCLRYWVRYNYSISARSYPIANPKAAIPIDIVPRPFTGILCGHWLLVITLAIITNITTHLKRPGGDWDGWIVNSGWWVYWFPPAITESYNLLTIHYSPTEQLQIANKCIEIEWLGLFGNSIGILCVVVTSKVNCLSNPTPRWQIIFQDCQHFLNIS